jgi:hypothetical protein
VIEPRGHKEHAEKAGNREDYAHRVLELLSHALLRVLCASVLQYQKRRKLVTSKTIVAALTLICALSSVGIAATIRPIVDVKSGYLLGGSDGKKWMNAKTIAAALRGKETYRVYDVKRRLSNGIGDKPESQGAPCPDTLFVDIKPKKGAIAVGGMGSSLPRIPQTLSSASPVYRKLVADILRKHGIKPNVQITQILRVDLEGDGSQEVLISATLHKGYGTPGSISARSLANEYSILFLRKVVGGKVITQMLHEEYYTKDMTFNAPEIFNIAGVWDLNGDGTMEIVTFDRYYEGNGTTVYEMRNNRAVKVLDSGCGA